MIIEEDQLRDLLRKAYDAGWYGCLELRDTAVDEIMSGFVSKKKEVLAWTMNYEGESQVVSLSFDSLGLGLVDHVDAVEWVAGSLNQRFAFDEEDEAILDNQE